MDRVAVYVPEKPNIIKTMMTSIKNKKDEEVRMIKEKYGNNNLSDFAALQIRMLEIKSENLKRAAKIAEIATTIDVLMPDPIPAADEAVLSGITALLNISYRFIDKNIDSLAKEGTPNIKVDEVKNISSQMINIINDIREKQGIIKK